MVERIFLASTIMGLISALPAKADLCDTEYATAMAARQEADNAEARYQTWAEIYDERTTIIYNTYNIVIGFCGDNIVCHEEALNGRNAQLDELEAERAPLMEDMYLKRDEADDAYFAYYACTVASGG